jgi:hypothetical protein
MELSNGMAAACGTSKLVAMGGVRSRPYDITVAPITAARARRSSAGRGRGRYSAAAPMKMLATFPSSNV